MNPEMNPIYSEEFKKQAIQKVLNRGPKSIKEVLKEVGVSDCSFYQWKKFYGTASFMDTHQKKRPQDWSATEKFQAVMEYEKLSESEQGEFLRKRGLHSDHMTQWKKMMQEALEPSLTEQLSRTEKKLMNRKIKELEKEIQKKDKVLAETTALLILKKKADAIWGSGGDDESS